MDAWVIKLREIFESLLSNDMKTFQSIRIHFLRVCQDIIDTGTTDPVITDQEYLEMIANTSGALDCLHFLGYWEAEGVGPYKPLYFTKSLDTHQARFFSKSLRCLQHYSDLLWTVHPRYPGLYSNAFALQVAAGFTMSPVFHQERENLKDSLRALIRLVRAYEDSRLIEKARALVPWENMIMDSKTKAACERDSSDALAFWDYLMVELARWFKMDFFQWCDEPLCPQCGLKTASAKSMLKPTPDETSHGANRVEAYNCASCNSVVRFPRYNSVEKLMETRIGRCGEWANCFTFFCRVLGFQARYVIDWHGDHVWTEYFSPCQKRWIHVDPCENIIDNPLMYEHGWSKQVTFIFGVARDHIADVTTRYSCDHKAVIQRRAARYHPGWLFDMVHGLNQELQMVMPQRERDFLNLQMVQDFMDMMYERRPSEASLKGRTSGSSTWVSARGEGGKTGAGYIFRPTSAEMEAGRIHIRYNCRLDAYERVVEGKTLGGWHNGTHHCGGIFRKEEFDWKMVYLARMDRVDQGFMSWRFELKDDYDCMYPIDTVFIRLEKATYENGSVKGVVCSRKTCAPLVVSNPETSTMAEYPMMKGSCSFMVQAALMGGTGSHAWQHAQLFRQSTMPHNHVDETWPFEVIVKFRPRPKDAERSLRTEKET